MGENIKVREKHLSVASWGPGLQLRQVPRPEVQLTTFGIEGPHPVH